MIWKMRQLRVVLGIVCAGFIGSGLFCVSIANAQSSTRKMLEKRSIPSSEVWRYLDRQAEFSPSEMRLIDQRSVFNAQNDAVIAKRSDFSQAEERLLAKGSEYSPQMMQVLEKRVEPDPNQVGGMKRRSRAESRWLKVDRVADPAMIALFLRRSTMSQTETKQIERASVQTDVLQVIQRASSFAGSQSEILSGRSRASASYLQLIRSRSTD